MRNCIILCLVISFWRNHSKIFYSSIVLHDIPIISSWLKIRHLCWVVIEEYSMSHWQTSIIMILDDQLMLSTWKKKKQCVRINYNIVCTSSSFLFSKIHRHMIDIFIACVELYTNIYIYMCLITKGNDSFFFVEIIILLNLC